MDKDGYISNGELVPGAEDDGGQQPEGHSAASRSWTRPSSTQTRTEMGGYLRGILCCKTISTNTRHLSIFEQLFLIT